MILLDSSWSYTPKKSPISHVLRVSERTFPKKPMGRQHPKMDLKPARYPSKNNLRQWLSTSVVCVPQFVYGTPKSPQTISMVFGAILSSTNPFTIAGVPEFEFLGRYNPRTSRPNPFVSYMIYLISQSMFSFILTVNPLLQ